MPFNSCWLFYAEI